MSILGKRSRESAAAQHFASVADHSEELTYKPINQIDKSLSQSINQPIKQSTSTVPAFLTELLPTSAITSISSKLTNKFVTLTPAPSVKHQYHRSVKPPKKQSTTGMNARQRKECGLFDIQNVQRIDQSNNQSSEQPQKQTFNYESLLPLHELWKSYVTDVLTDQSLQSVQAANKMIKADYHGAILTVTRSNNPSFIGQSGICVQETQEIFRLVNQSNKLINVPKHGCVFTIELSSNQSSGKAVSQTIELFGNQLRVRASERAAKKFKNKPNCRL